MNNTNLKPIIITVIIGLIVGGLILGWDKPDETDEHHDDHHETAHHLAANDEENQPRTGPEGGKLFTTDDFSVEITIFEQGVEPQFRVYTYKNGKLLPPSETKLAITLSRLGAPAQLVQFTAQGDHLLGDQIIEEPHSFEVTIAAEWQNKTYHWKYDQVEARIEMSDNSLQSTGIKIQSAGPAIIKPTLQLPGIIEFNHHNIVRVVPRAPGIVLEVEKHLGQQVKKGEILAVIESQILADLRSQYLAAEKRLNLARTTYIREKQLWEEKITAKQDYLAAQQLLNEAEITRDLIAAKLRSFGEDPDQVSKIKNITCYQVRAPISGLVVTKTIAKGQVIKEDSEIYTLADISTMYASLTIYPKDLSTIKLGQEAIIKASSSSLEGTGVVSYISAIIDEKTRTAKAHVTLENPHGQWRAGMFINIGLITEEIKVPIAVSTDALQTLYDWTVVFGRYGDYFEARPIELGRSDGQMVEVLGGLHEGEQYAAGNSFAIKAELGKAGTSHVH